MIVSIKSYFLSHRGRRPNVRRPNDRAPKRRRPNGGAQTAAPKRPTPGICSCPLIVHQIRVLDDDRGPKWNRGQWYWCMWCIYVYGIETSKASGLKTYSCRKAWYFWVFLSSAITATAPDWAADAERYDGASVSIIATPHTRLLPAFQKMSVSPSGRFPYERSGPCLSIGNRGCLSGTRIR